MSRALLSGWTSDHQNRPRTPVRVTAVPQPCEAMCIHLCRTTPHHHATNGLVERLLRTLKAVIVCRMDEQCTGALPLVLLSTRTAYKEDQQSPTGELVYDEPLRITGEFLVPAAPKVEASVFVQQLRRHKNKLCPRPAARHASPATFIHKDLRNLTHIFLRQDAISHALEPPYSGSHKVIARTDKTLKIVIRGRQVTVSTDRVKPACLLEGTQHDTSNPRVSHIYWYKEKHSRFVIR